MSQNHIKPEERSGLHLSAPALTGIVAGVAAIAVAATLALTPHQTVSTSTTQPAATQQETHAETALVSIPNVVGLERQHAEQAISNAHLDLGNETENYSDTVPAGCIISQDPSAGVLANKESKVNLVVSKGRQAPAESTMPDLIGKTREEAEQAIRDAKLVAVQDGDQVTDKVAPGRVCAQSVQAGTTLKQDTYVSYSIAIAPDTSVLVPNVAGESVTDARNQLTDAGLSSDTALAYSSTVAKDNVISQSVTAGTRVAKGTVVSLTVSMGAKPSGDIEVPNVVGKNSNDATSTLQNAGLTVSPVSEYSDDVAKDNVISQSIAAGTKVAKDTPVTITVSMGPREDGSITVPDATGQPADDVESQFTDLGLGVERSETYSEQVAAGNVIGQSIPAGTKVAKGTIVTLTVSMGAKPEPPKPEPATVQVPDIMTYTRDEAIQAIQSAGLVERWSGEENGNVVAQDPPAGTEVADGSVVTFKLEHVSSKVEVPDVADMTATDAEYQLNLVGLGLEYDPQDGDRVLSGTDPVAGALLDEGTMVTPVFAEPTTDPESDQKPEPEPQRDDDQEPTPDPDQEPEPDQEPTSDADQEPEPEPEPDDDQDADPTPAPTDQKTMLQDALDNAGVNYKVVKILSTQASNDGTDYTLLCSDETGNYNVVIHIPGTSGAEASLVSATPTEE